MKIITKYIEFSTVNELDVVNITQSIQDNLAITLLEEGNVLISCIGSTAGISTIEYESGLVEDIQNYFKNSISSDINYAHDEKWHDSNGHSHIRSTILKTSIVIPFVNSQLLLGTWQQIIFIEFDNKPRKRKLVTQFIGI